jgi:hypothetical protein
MSRVIMFRCWHAGNERDTGGFYKGHEPKMLYDGKPGDSLRWKSEGQNITEVMQFTGILDRNEHEIFEGDVVKWYVNDVVREGIVEFVDGWGGYDLKHLRDDQHVCNDWLRGEYEVIGNVYEHPDLLK